MGRGDEFGLVYEIFVPASGHPEEVEDSRPGARLDVTVIFTSTPATVAALRRAAELAARLEARILLVVPQLVPFPLPLHQPPVPVEFNEARLREIAAASSMPTAVRIYLCRERITALRMALRPGSLVVVGGRKRWWPTAESRLARILRREGHEVIFTEIQGGAAS